jgi:hypothetical protein
MEEMVVTRLWMGGIMVLMVCYAVIAVIGANVKKKRDSDKS